MERRNFLVAWITSILYAIFPSLRPKLAQKTYGGMDLRHMLRGNSEFRKLEVPYFIEEGVPIGLINQEKMIAAYDQPWSLSNVDVQEICSTGTTGGTRVTPAS